MSVTYPPSTKKHAAVTFCTAFLLLSAGCREDKPGQPAPPEPGGSGGAAPKVPRPDEAASTDEAPARRGVDDLDDPNAPACLPKSLEVGQWTKCEPVRVAGAASRDRLISREEAERLSQFAVDSVARCAYTLPTGDAVKADVLLVNASTAADAYGLMSCHSGARPTLDIGGETRRDERGSSLHLHCWQGTCYVHVRADKLSVEIEDEVVRLLRYIAAHIPRADDPELLEALPTDRDDPGRRWLVRSLGSLSAEAIGLSPAPDLAKIGELLGLSQDTWMGIASYEMPEARRPNVVWVVRYPTSDAAAAAYARYSGYIAGDRGPAWESTSLMPSHGAFLIGTWTAEEESLQYMMPRIRQLLPT